MTQHHRAQRLVMAAAVAWCAWGSHAMAVAPAAVACHYTYGGEERVLLAKPVQDPYSVPTMAVGSYFQFKVVYQTTPADVAAVKVYTYADRDTAPVLIHQASYPNNAAALRPAPQRAHDMPYGFTGRQWVYEPVRDGELQYWCEWKVSP